ncbi:hypothetical protein Glove_246g1 [Diversispora epigaea]|uniref:Uncharacterized protein n=1 Tax=Diversispora epigaea TaxID=1348612 RepID=A0A397IGE5_9GLOM|nr:hypothetical protein Glove_246g1 [Diversispora epigaea]
MNDVEKLHRSETRGVADYQVRLFIALIIASPIIVSAGRATYSSFSHSDDAGTESVDNNKNNLCKLIPGFYHFPDVCKDESSNGLAIKLLPNPSMAKMNPSSNYYFQKGLIDPSS